MLRPSESAKQGANTDARWRDKCKVRTPMQTTMDRNGNGCIYTIIMCCVLFLLCCSCSEECWFCFFFHRLFSPLAQPTVSSPVVHGEVPDVFVAYNVLHLLFVLLFSSLRPSSSSYPKQRRTLKQGEMLRCNPINPNTLIPIIPIIITLAIGIFFLVFFF